MARVNVSPSVCAYSDENFENLHIEVELPGVDKKDVSFRMQEDSFTVDASRENIRYVGTYAIYCPVDPDKAKATFRNGLLAVDVPYKEEVPEEARQIPISE
ncbi:Hsp20/alpha crystallin family protein [Methanoculleus sp. FWC-SCC1]|uniref:Hsp20/alpha crystallin family protein n=1 Tax=Methanoculleus frigidifontis TaxID=2584085 RepID=A0ABT8MD76_9EURY|nr:Hsp20/alpha crystallin family protein [Methanoculleus sp. FWC-SCC1]MDN7025886.1 Hsp20/alpha crystallin family protein [Methanoculleus sp. FWC-SCC1]